MRNNDSSTEAPKPLTTTYRAASHDLQCCERQVWQLVNDGKLSVIRIGRSVRIPVAELEAFIARQVAANEQGGAA